MLEPMLRYSYTQRKHLEAPLIAERELFLTHLEFLAARAQRTVYEGGLT
jgi:hypothetical protein